MIILRIFSNYSWQKNIFMNYYCRRRRIAADGPGESGEHACVRTAARSHVETLRRPARSGLCFGVRWLLQDPAAAAAAVADVESSSESDTAVRHPASEPPDPVRHQLSNGGETLLFESSDGGDFHPRPSPQRRRRDRRRVKMTPVVPLPKRCPSAITSTLLWYDNQTVVKLYNSV